MLYTALLKMYCDMSKRMLNSEKIKPVARLSSLPSYMFDWVDNMRYCMNYVWIYAHGRIFFYPVTKIGLWEAIVCMKTYS